MNVTSEVEFIGLEFTESYYYKPEKKWYAVAYMIRDDAWVQYKPKIEAEKQKNLTIFVNLKGDYGNIYKDYT